MLASDLNKEDIFDEQCCTPLLKEIFLLFYSTLTRVYSSRIRDVQEQVVRYYEEQLLKNINIGGSEELDCWQRWIHRLFTSNSVITQNSYFPDGQDPRDLSF